MELANTCNVRRTDDLMILVEFAFVALSEDGTEELDPVGTIEMPEVCASKLNSQLTRILTSAE